MATRRNLRLGLLLLGAAAAITAAARPQWTEAIDPTTGRGRDVIIAVDVSRSMLADDLPPSRIKRAQMVAEDLVRQLHSDRIGLVAFAGSAFLQAPVTADHASVLVAMQELSPELIPLPGTNISAALRCASEAFDHSEAGQRALVLITDGEELEEDAIALAKELSAKMRIFTVGVGSAEGSVLSVPAPNGGVEYIKDASGDVVRSKLDESRLREIAQAGGGFYTKLVSGPAEVRHIIEAGISLMDEHELQLEGRTITAEGYQWPLAAGLLMLTVGFLLGEGRSGSAPASRNAAPALLLVLGFTLCAVTPAAAAGENGKAFYSAGQYGLAQEAFQSDFSANPQSAERAFNLGAAAYKNQKWAEAIDAFGKALQTSDKILRSRAEYNFANTLVQQARQGRRGQDTNTLHQAIDHYEESLRADPQFADAQANLEVVKKLLQQPPPQQQQKQKDSKDQNQDKNQQDLQDESESDSNEKSDSKDSGKGKNEQQKQDSGKGDKKENDSKDSGKDSEKDPKNSEGSTEGDKDGQSSKQNQPQGKEEEPPGDKERGELKNSPVDAPDKPKPEKEQEAQAGGSGKITRDQARALLDALRSEDRRVNLWATENQKQAGKMREGKTW